MRKFVCTRIKSQDYVVLTYKSHTIAKYDIKLRQLTVGYLGGFSDYIFDCLRDFVIDECSWLYRSLDYPLSTDDFKEALNEAIKNQIVLCDNTLY